MTTPTFDGTTGPVKAVAAVLAEDVEDDVYDADEFVEDEPEQLTVKEFPELTYEAPDLPVPLGTAVVYIATNGRQKLAFALGTPATVGEGSSHVAPLADNQLHLEVHSLRGNVYQRRSVPFSTDPEARNVWRLV
jgi:hypothetical protein